MKPVKKNQDYYSKPVMFFQDETQFLISTNFGDHLFLKTGATFP